MKPVELSERNTLFTEKMGEFYDLNLGLIRGARRNYLIDTGLGSGSIAPVTEYLRGDGKPVVVINTHCHWDHVWGNFLFEGGTIISHRRCYELMEEHWDEMAEENKTAVDGEMRKCFPNLTFEGGLYFPDDGVRIFFTPGHSEDGISVYDGVDKVLYAGDNIGDTAEEIVPYIDTDIETFRRTIEIYKTYDFNICVSGHNKPQGRDILSRMENALEESWKKQIAQFGMPGEN
ncbi:MAG: MBL fold metallo-hydrolase [Clostridiales bacterium]|jgi:glyoxylase-like metal-dependent hydrolase (beta-lactamase superfamily II)|nr:MBL fold metallo-hydrolase [Clostridiales bacterium]